MKRNSLITLSALALLGLSGTVLAAEPVDRVDARLDRKGERIDQRLDQRG